MNDLHTRLDVDLSALAEKHQYLSGKHASYASALRSPPSSDEETIVRLYLKLRNLSKVATQLRQSGHLKPNGRSYQSEDVKALVLSFGGTGNTVVDALAELAKAQFEYGFALQPKLGHW